MALSTKVGSFTAPTATGSQTVAHGLGTTPKAIIFFGGHPTTNGFASDAMAFVGFTDGTTSYAVAARTNSGISPSEANRRMAAVPITMANDAAGTRFEAAFTSWDATNFTLNWTVAPFGNIVNYIALGGDDLTSAKVLKWETQTATGVQDVAGFGFRPDLAFHSVAFNYATGALPLTGSDAHFNLGVMDKYGNQWVNSFWSDDAQPTSDTGRAQRTDLCVYQDGVGGGAFARAKFHEMTSDGFKVDWVNSPGSQHEWVISLALKGPGMKVGAFQKTTAAAPASQSVTGTGFTPKALLLSALADAPNASTLAGANWNLGATSGASSSKAIAIRDQDAQATTSAQGYQGDKAYVDIAVTAASSLLAAADLTSFDASGFTLNFTTNSGAADQICYVAFGDTPAADPTGTLAKVGSLTTSTTTGYQQITGVGFRPKALILLTVNAQAAGFRNDFPLTVGFAAGSSEQYSCSARSSDAAAAANTSRRMASLIFSSVDANETVGAEGSLVSFDADGFIINWTSAFGSARIINYIALGGSDLANAKAIQWTSPTAVGNKAVTGLGFKPDLLFHMFCGELTTPLPSTATDAVFSFGVMDKSGNQWANAFKSIDAADPTNTQREQYTNACLTMMTGALATEFRASYVSMDTDGFTTNWSAVGATARPVISLALKGPGVKVGAFQKTTAAAPASQSVTGTGFTPKALLFSSVGIGAPSTAPDVGSLWSLGATSAAASSKSIAIRDNDALATTSVQGYQADKAVASVNRATASTVSFEADLTSFDSSGFTLNWTTNDANAHEILYVAIGNAVTETAGTLAKVGSFSTPGSSITGHQQVTGLGFRPKALIFYSVLAGGGFNVHGVASLGFTTGSSFQYATHAAMDHNVSTSNTGRGMVKKAITGRYDSGVSVEASLVSLDGDGFTLNWEIMTASAYTINYIAIGGEDVTGARVVEWNYQSGSAGTNTNVTGVGFSPDLVLHTNVFGDIMANTPPITGAHAHLGLGAMDRDGNQWANHIVSKDNVNPANTNRAQRTDSCLVALEQDGTIHTRFSFVSMNADGFTVFKDQAGVFGSFVAPVAALCLKGPRFKVGSFNQATSTGSQAVTGLGFTPKGILLSSIRETATTAPQPHAFWSLGAASGASDERGIVVRDEDAVSPTDVERYQSNTALMTMLATNAPSTIGNQADLSSLDSDGFTLNWTTNAGTANQILYFAIGAVNQDSGFTGWGWPI